MTLAMKAIAIFSVGARALIVALLALHLPALLLTYAAAGSTLSSMDDVSFVATIILGYILLVFVALVIAVRFRDRKWAWFVAGAVATFWPIIFALRDTLA